MHNERNASCPQLAAATIAGTFQVYEASATVSMLRAGDSSRSGASFKMHPGKSGTPFGVLRQRNREPGVSPLDPRLLSVNPSGWGEPDKVLSSPKGTIEGSRDHE